MGSEFAKLVRAPAKPATLPGKQMARSSPTLRRKCSCEGSGQSCPACAEEMKSNPDKNKLLRKATGAAKPNQAPPIVHEVLSSPGQPLDAATRSFMEPRFGHDFGHVRVHAGAKAAESARAVHALAYTVGRDIVFGSGQYPPQNPAAQLLVAHELTHVLQQSGKERIPASELGAENTPQEQEATALSLSVLTGPARRNRVNTSENAKPGAVQGGWPLIAIGAGVGALLEGGKAYYDWAKGCLLPLEPQMQTATFAFRQWYYEQIHAPVPNKIWDAFGHCWIACEGTKRCGSKTTAIAGKGREFWRQYIDSKPHDSYQQDTNNQTLGRRFGRSGADCTVSCRNAISPGGGMDLSAPPSKLWTPEADVYPAPAPTPPTTPARPSPPDAGVRPDAG